jgi:hypothetical protein
METQEQSMTKVPDPVDVHVKATAVLFQAEPEHLDRDSLVWLVGVYNRYWARGNKEGCQNVANEIDKLVAKYFPGATKGWEK